MTPTAEAISGELLDWLVARCNLTTGTREDFLKFAVRKLDPVVPSAQKSLSFEDAEALKGQSMAMIRLLKQRRSAGVMTHELAAIALKYSSRLDDLRKAGWRISCTKLSGRTYRYTLAATDW